jgi:hypothetical protein
MSQPVGIKQATRMAKNAFFTTTSPIMQYRDLRRTPHYPTACSSRWYKTTKNNYRSTMAAWTSSPWVRIRVNSATWPGGTRFQDGLGLDSIDALEMALAISMKYDFQTHPNQMTTTIPGSWPPG